MLEKIEDELDVSREMTLVTDCVHRQTRSRVKKTGSMASRGCPISAHLCEKWGRPRISVLNVFTASIRTSTWSRPAFSRSLKSQTIVPAPVRDRLSMGPTSRKVTCEKWGTPLNPRHPRLIMRHLDSDIHGGRPQSNPQQGNNQPQESHHLAGHRDRCALSGSFFPSHPSICRFLTPTLSSAFRFCFLPLSPS